MILSEVRNYLKTHGRASLADLSAHLGSDPDALRGMLQKWIAKGRVRKLLRETDLGGGCCGCSRQSPEVYEWRE